MNRNFQSPRRLPALAYAACVCGIVLVVGSALLDSSTPSAEAASCDVLPVIRAVDADAGPAPERLQITVVGKRAHEVARAQAAGQQS